MKFGPSVGDTGVVGTVRNIRRWPLGSCGTFNPNVSANGYASVAQNLEAQFGAGCGDIPVSGVPKEISNGDWVTVTIAEGNGVLIATNMQAA